MRLKALIGATLLTLAAGATFAWRPAPEATPPAVSGVPAPLQIAAFRAQAEQSCRCARTRTDAAGKKDCWAGFEKAIAPWPHNEGSTACEFSQRSICFGDWTEENCIIADWSAAVGGPGSMCTEDEARTAEAIWTEAYHRYEKGLTKDSPDRVLARTLTAFARNDRVALRKSQGSCTNS